MLYIPRQTAASVEDYYKSIKDRLIKAKGASTLPQVAKDFLSISKIEQIICDEPRKLLKHHKDILSNLGVGFDLRDYNRYCSIKKKQDKDRTDNERVIFNIYSPVINQLTKVFNYEEFITKHKITSYKLANQLNRNTCTYCNRLYTNTVITKDKITGQINEKTRLTRPQFDHWYPQNKFPILALSFYNLIPSCSVCNSSIKGDTVFSINTHTHPYIKSLNEEFTFTFEYADVNTNNVEIIVADGSKIDKTLKAFKIKEVYNAHSEFELKDLLELRYAYSENYLDTLFNKTFDIKVDKPEIYRMIFGAEYNKKQFHKRPFSKFKKDILNKLGVKC